MCWRNKSRTFVLYLIVLFFLASCVQEDDSARKANELANGFLAESGVSGLAISVGINDSIIYSEGFGFADVEQQVPVMPALTRFRVGSVAKAMTAMALGHLHEAGKIDLDAPIQSYLPDFPEKEGIITARLLAGHLAGIRHYQNDENLSATPFSSVQDGLAIFEDDPLVSAPGTEFHYSTFGFNLLSAVIEAAARQDFLSYMSENVFGPVGMQRTSADKVIPIISNRARYYERTDENLVNAPWVDNSYKWAGGGFLSTSEDLVRFGLAHLSENFLRRDTIEMMWTPQRTPEPEELGYGIGWWIRSDEKGRRVVRHGGTSVGGSTDLRIYQESGLVIVVISNTSGEGLVELLGGGEIDLLANDIAEVFLASD